MSQALKPVQSRPLRILICTCTHWWNAEAAYAAAVGCTMQAAGHHVWVLTPPSHANANAANAHACSQRGLSLLNCPLWSDSPHALFAAIRQLRRFLIEQSIDVVNVFRSRELPYVLWACRGLPIRVVGTRGKAKPLPANWLNRWLLLKKCDDLVAPSQVCRHFFSHALKVPAEHISLIPYPVQGQPVADDAALQMRKMLQERWNTPPNGHLLAIVARIAPEKGHFLLWQAMQKVLRTNPHTTLLVLNKDEGPPELAAHLKHTQSAMGLSDHIHWLGFQQNVDALMAAVDIGVVPSIASEAICRVPLEFALQGTPVVAFPTGALPEVIEHKKTGWLTEAQDSDQLAEGLLQLLNDDALRQALGNAARSHVLKHYHLNDFSEKTLQVFKGAGPI